METPKIERTRTRLYESGGSDLPVAAGGEPPAIDGYVLGSMVAGALPAPVLDLAAISAVQLGMLARICEHYGRPFSESRGRAIIGALAGGVLSTSLNVGIVTSLFKVVPIFGPIFGAVSLPVWAGATTWALARVFREHFENGGTLLDLDSSRVRGTFSRYVTEGRAAVASLRK